VHGYPRASAKQFLGRGANGKKDRKIVKNTENSTIKPLPGGGATENRPIIAKKTEK